jgi:hypothetical protein
VKVIITFRKYSSASMGALVLTASLAGEARADRRAYAETYEAVTAPKGELDVELWNTYSDEGEVSNGPPGRGYRGMIELEYGLTNRWDVALYNLFDATSDGSGTGWGGLKVETRYRLSQPGDWVVDPVIYFEYQYLRHGDARHKAEVKLIVAKDVARWNFAVNLAGEVERLVDDAGYVPELEYAAGVSRELFGPTLKLGVEAFGRAEKPPGEEVESFLWAGPALSFAQGYGGRLHGVWVTVGGGKGLVGDSKAWYARAIVGLQF